MNIVELVSETKHSAAYLVGIGAQAEAFILEKPSNYLQQYFTTMDDPSGAYFQASSVKTEETGDFSTVLAIRNQPAGQKPTPRIQMEDKNKRGARQGWVGRSP